MASFSGSSGGGAWMKVTSGAGSDEIDFADNISNVPVSIYASGSIVADGDGVFVGATVNWSDARIKEVKGISDAEEDLNTLTQIEITDYRRIHGGEAEKKVIAQQVREVFPLAVSFRAGVVPSIYEHIEHFSYEAGAQALTIQTVDPHGLQAGDEVDYYTEADKFTKQEVLTVVSETEFLVAASSLPAELFVFGKWVDDVHSVDYQAISMLNVSATQEQQRIIEAQQAEIDALKAANARLSDQNTSFEARLQAIEAMMPVNQ